MLAFLFLAPQLPEGLTLSSCDESLFIFVAPCSLKHPHSGSIFLTGFEKTRHVDKRAIGAIRFQKRKVRLDLRIYGR